MQRGFRILFIIVLCAGCSESKSTGGSQSADGDGESRASADVASTGTDDVAKAPATDVAVSKPAEDVVSADAGRGGDVGTGELPMCSAGAGKGKRRAAVYQE